MIKKKSKVLITGIAGFGGSFLADLLNDKGYRLYGLLAPGEKTDNIRHLKRGIDLDRLDITSAGKVKAYVKKIKPRYLFHLAAMASVGQSFAKERLTYDVNFTGSLNIFEAAVSVLKDIRKLVVIGSADSYGAFRPVNRLLKEDQPFAPISPYGISKAAMEYLAEYYLRQYRLPVVIARPFNHTGPRQSDTFVVPSFCRQIASIEKGRKKPLMKVGNLEVKRDLSDVRDIVKGYYAIAVRGKPGEVYHLSSGRSVSIKAVLDRLRKMSSKEIKVTIDKSRFRKADIPILRGDNSKAGKELAWQPEYELSETLKDTLDFWRGRV
jgi:GDP-4-dehydro-6-deoxy-D-mannose reductase